MRKKIIASALIAAVTAASLSGCGLLEDLFSSRASESASVSQSPAQKSDSYVYPESAEEVREEEVYYDEAAGEAPYTEALYAANGYDPYYDDFNTEEYGTLEESGFKSVLTSPLSTFAADVDTASYANLRRMILDGYTPDEIPSGAVRTEELLNYFRYDYEGPEKGEPFGVNAEIAACPWNEDHELLMLGLQTEVIDLSDAPDSNLVFLIDTSGSMDEELPLLKRAFSLLVEELDEKDTVSIVTYAGSDEVLLEGVTCDRKSVILDALNSLEAYGSTNGGAGIQTAYALAAENFIKGGNNRVILATDGDLNVGLTSESELHDLIKEEAKTGVFLSVLGFGYANYSDTNLETLADNGNGNYSYIDSVAEAKKVLVSELGSTLLTVAKDVKLQVEFNPENVSAYRLIGYENRTMAAEDFDDDTKDGGEIGAGHSVTVLYELVPAGADEDGEDESGLRYQKQTVNNNKELSDEWLTLSIRYKEPEGDESELLEYHIGSDFLTRTPSDDLTFAAGVAEFGMVLHNSEYLGDGSLENTYALLKSVNETDEYRDEFIYLVSLLKRSAD